MGRHIIKSEIYKDLPKPSILLYNITENTAIFNIGADVQRPLSSLTKLMTAVVMMDAGYPLDEVLPFSNVRPPDVIPEQQYTRAELLKALLIYSDNAAAETLAEHYPGGRTGFLTEMNAVANKLGMKSTYFVDPHGYKSQSYSSASDLMLLIQYAVQKHPCISTFSTLKHLEFTFDNPDDTVSLDNINISLLTEFSEICLSKTGRSTTSGYCYAMALNHNNCTYGLVMLGSPTHAVKEAFARKLIHNYITCPFDQVK